MSFPSANYAETFKVSLGTNKEEEARVIFFSMVCGVDGIGLKS